MVETVLYMKKAERPSRETLAELVSMLQDPVENLVRKDSKFKTLGLEASHYVGDAKAVVDVLVEHPALLERPVIVRGNKAIIGRPRDRVPGFLAR